MREFDDDLEGYTRSLTLPTTVTPRQDAQAAPSRRDQRRLDAQARAQSAILRKPLEVQLRKLEAEIEQLTQRKADIENRMAAPDMYEDSNKAQLRESLLEQADVSRQLESAEEQWLELSTQLEQV